MQTESARARAMQDTRDRILGVALDLLGESPDAGMGEIASAAGVVRRTVYGHFPTRADLVHTLAEQAVGEIAEVLTEITSSQTSADSAWAEFIARLWPLTRRYRVILALRRGEQGEEIHALLEPVDVILADLVQRGQDSAAFGRHLPADVLSQLAFSAVFSIADNALSTKDLGAGAAIVTSLLLMGVAEPRAAELAAAHPSAR